jgi:DNA polymerase III sliding clamp (beta) subunit (PCNA family)
MLVKTKDFNVAVKNAMRARSKDENRPIFENIHVFTEDDKLVIEAVDGYRLHQSKIEIQENDEKLNFNILVKELKTVKSKANLIEILLSNDVLKIDENLYKVDSESAKNYLNYKHVIPNYENEMYICVNAFYLSEALKDIANELEKGKTDVKIQFEKSGEGIGKISPILLTSGNQTNIVLPIRSKG